MIEIVVVILTFIIGLLSNAWYQANKRQNRANSAKKEYEKQREEIKQLNEDIEKEIQKINEVILKVEEKKHENPINFWTDYVKQSDDKSSK